MSGQRPARFDLVFGDDSNDRGRVQAFCPSCAVIVATVWPQFSDSETPGAHGRAGRPYVEEHVKGFVVVPELGFVNAPKRHPNGMRWYRHGDPRQTAAKVAYPALLTCRCRQDVVIDAPFPGFDSNFREHAVARSRPKRA